MSSRTFDRKDFLILTVTMVTGSTLAACGEETPAPAGGSGSGGTPGGGGMAGTPAAGGSTSGTGGSTAGGTTGGGGSGGSSAGGGGTGGGSSGGGGTGGGGGSSGGGGSGGGGGGACGDLSVKSSGLQHTHMLMIPGADITAGVTKKYQTSMDDPGPHSHWVELTAADFTTLKGGGEVKKISCSGGDHEYVLKCGGGGTAPVVPTAAQCPEDNDCGESEAMTCP